MKARRQEQIQKKYKSLEVLNDNRRSTTTSVADTCNTIFAFILFKHCQKRLNDSSSGNTNRMTKSNCSSVHINLLDIKIKEFHDAEGSSSKSLIEFEVFNLWEFHASNIKCFLGRFSRCNAEIHWINFAVSVRDNSSKRR